MYPQNPQSEMPAFEATPAPGAGQFNRISGVEQYTTAAYDAYNTNNHQVNPVNMPAEQRSALGAAAQYQPNQEAPVTANTAAFTASMEMAVSPEMHQLYVIGNNLCRVREDAINGGNSSAVSQYGSAA